MTTYEYSHSGYSITQKSFDSFNLGVAGETIDTMGARMVQGFKDGIEAQLKQMFLEHNVEVTTFWIDNVAYEKTVTHTPNKYEPYYAWQIKLIWKFTYRTNQPISESPFPVWALWLIEKAITAIVIVIVAYFAIQAIKDVLLSMVTTTTETTTITYDEAGNVIKKTTEKKQDPSSTGWIGVIVVVGLVLGVLIVLPSLTGKKTSRRRK